MKRLIILSSIFCLVGCNSSLKNSVIDPLSIKELNSIINKDTLFQYTYQMVQLVRDSGLKTDLDKAKFVDLNYKTFHKYVKMVYDTTLDNQISARASIEWTNKYGIYSSKVDSVSKWWKKYNEDNSLNNYAKVELVNIRKEYYEYLNEIENVNLIFKYTPLKGPIQEMKFSYEIKPKDVEKDTSEFGSIFNSLEDPFNKSYCLILDPFSTPRTGMWEVNYANEIILKNKTLKTFLQDYDIKIDIYEIRKDGIKLTEEDLNIPSSIEHYWDTQKSILADYYIKDIVKEVLKKEYLTETEYICAELDEVYKEKYPLAFEFHQLLRTELKDMDFFGEDEKYIELMPMY